MLYLHASSSLLAPLLYPSLLALLLLSFSIFLPRLLWSFSLHDKNRTSSKECSADQVDDDCLTSEGETEEDDLFYASDDCYCSGDEDLVADVVFGGQALFFLPTGNKAKEDDTLRVDSVEESCDDKQVDSLLHVDGVYVPQSNNIVPESSCRSKMEDLVPEPEEVVDQIPPAGDNMSTPSNFHTPNSSLHDYEVDGGDDNDDFGTCNDEKTVDYISKEEKNITTILDKTEPLFVEEGNNKTVLDPPKKVVSHEGDELAADSSTAGSTSKSSCEWRGSTNFRDSETDGFFSSSSRRSSSNWESFAVYRKYDEDMMFFDRISSQKLRETETLRSIKVQPRSISERIVHKLTSSRRPPRLMICRNPYQELEAAYVAQICLAWEALNWTYKSFQRVTAERRKDDPGFPARVAQQFQQFHVLLQRYIENEPYECGRRPEVFARMRISSPNLLQVPEFHEGEEVKEDMFSRISSARFLKIMEDVIRTFMSFLKADREKQYWKQVLRAFAKTKPTSVDPSLLNLIKKAHRKKKARLKDLERSRNCVARKRNKLKEQDEMETLMGLIDMKVVSRVLRTPEIMTEEQLHWCEEKMSRVRFWNGRVQRDSSPLFFPAP